MSHRSNCKGIGEQQESSKGPVKDEQQSTPKLQHQASDQQIDVVVLYTPIQQHLALDGRER